MQQRRFARRPAATAGVLRRVARFAPRQERRRDLLGHSQRTDLGHAAPDPATARGRLGEPGEAAGGVGAGGQRRTVVGVQGALVDVVAGRAVSLITGVAGAGVAIDAVDAAAVDAGIDSVEALKGKVVNIGNPGSGQYHNAVDALQAAGLNPKNDIDAEKVKASEAPILLQEKRIDAFFCTVGHPSEALQNATSAERRVRFIPITGSGIDQLVAEAVAERRFEVAVGPGGHGGHGGRRDAVFQRGWCGYRPWDRPTRSRR